MLAVKSPLLQKIENTQVASARRVERWPDCLDLIHRA